MTLTTLVVEDDVGMRESLEDFFAAKGCRAFAAGTVARAREILAQNKIDLAVLDLGLPDASGLDLLREIRASDTETTGVVITANQDVRTAVEAMKAGAYDYLSKPFDIEEMRSILRRLTDLHALKADVRAYDYQRARAREERTLLGESAPMKALHDIVARAAEMPTTSVLVLGETGTGKELVAEAIHERSARRSKPLTKINCSAIPASLIESELFGHERGAFTDARTSKPGVFELADGGTLFLDEVGELQPEVQPKLLRVLERQPFRRVGGTRDLQTNVRVVAATNRDLSALVRTGKFREDLLYRLRVVVIEVPPLRERGHDVVMLAETFVRRIAADLKRPSKSLARETKEILLRHVWPGNVRELRNVVERAMMLHDGESIEPPHLPPEIHEAALASRHRQRLAPADGMSLDAIERAHVFYVLEQVGGNKSEAARRLGISRNALKDRLRRYGVSDAGEGVDLPPSA